MKRRLQVWNCFSNLRIASKAAGCSCVLTRNACFLADRFGKPAICFRSLEPTVDDDENAPVTRQITHGCSRVLNGISGITLIHQAVELAICRNANVGDSRSLATRLSGLAKWWNALAIKVRALAKPATALTIRCDANALWSWSSAVFVRAFGFALIAKLTDWLRKRR